MSLPKVIPEQNLNLSAVKVRDCRYGENPQQQAAVFEWEDEADRFRPSAFVQVDGHPMSYVNETDRDRLLRTMILLAVVVKNHLDFVPHIALAVKHGNICGAAIGNSKEDVLRKMLQSDLIAVFGAYCMTNFLITESLAEILVRFGLAEGQKRRPIDGVIAPRFSDAAKDILRRKGDTCALQTNVSLCTIVPEDLNPTIEVRPIRGGCLAQTANPFVLDIHDPRITWHNGELSKHRLLDLLLAWSVCATTLSNTITIARHGMLLGNGVSGRDRVGVAKIALMYAERMGFDLDDAVVVSDSFFPFVDGPEMLIRAGVGTIFTTTGSVRDEEVMRTILESGKLLLTVPNSVGRIFFGH